MNMKPNAEKVFEASDAINFKSLLEIQLNSSNK